MRKFSLICMTIFALLILAAPAQAAVTNVASGADVTLNGGAFFTGGWGGGMVVSASTIVDSVFLPVSRQWDRGPVWWDSRDGQDRWAEVDLGQKTRIDSLIIQADDNDAYRVSYKDTTTNAWVTLWNVPRVGGWGMQTRPNRYDNNQRYMLPAPVVTTAIKVEGNMYDSDRLFAVSELQAFGEAAGITADIDVDPDVLNLSGNGKFITAFIELPAGYDVADIDVNTVTINGVLAALPSPTEVGDHDSDGIADLMVKFDRQTVSSWFSASGEETLVVEGSLPDGTAFAGEDTIGIIS